MWSRPTIPKMMCKRRLTRETTCPGATGPKSSSMPSTHSTTTATTTIQKKSQNAVINKNKLMWNDIQPQNLTQQSNPRTNKTTESENKNAIHYTKSAESTISEMIAPAGNSRVNHIQPQIAPSNKEPVPTYKGAGRESVPQPKRPPMPQPSSPAEAATQTTPTNRDGKPDNRPSRSDLT